jgi:hypothetical protein
VTVAVYARKSACLRMLLALLGLLVLTTSASAECAWVLWANIYYANGIASGWGTVAAYSDVAGCIQRLDTFEVRGMYTERLAPTTLTRGPGPGAGPSASSPLVSWQCLPDTVEPRGPQGMK